MVETSDPRIPFPEKLDKPMHAQNAKPLIPLIHANVYTPGGCFGFEIENAHITCALSSPTFSRLSQVDTKEAVKEFEEALAAFDATAVAEEMGISKDMVEVIVLIEAYGSCL